MRLKGVNKKMRKEIVHVSDKQKLAEENNDKFYLSMHNLKTNFDKFFDITKTFLGDDLNKDNNIQHYSRKPSMSDSAIIALSLTQEALGIDSENYFWAKLKTDHKKDFKKLIDRSNFNRRRKRLRSWIQELTRRRSKELSEGENIFIIDSIPIPVCQIAREKRSKVCKENFESAPDKGYSAVSKSFVYGYKLHLVTSMQGIFQCMELTKASMHDIHYLNEIKHSRLNNCTLIADKGYLSSEYQLDLFTTCNIKLMTPMRSNQKNYKPQEFIFRKNRKRIETLFSQLCDQMMLKRNYAKTSTGLSTRIICKIAALTILQFINKKNNKPINHLKHALAA